MKRLSCIICGVILAICLVFIFPTEAEAASESDLTFTLNSDGESYFVADCDTDASGALEIPAIYEGKPVTSIGYAAFKNCSSLTSITIPDGVTSIEPHAFADCTSLASVTIPDSVTGIYYNAFCDCTRLTNVIIGDGVTYIGQSVFSGCNNLISVTIGNSVTKISEAAFLGCSSLTSITIPDSVTSIDILAFSACTNLSSVTIGNNVTSIGNYAFSNCSGLTSVTIPDSVASIGTEAFYYCINLTDITIGDGITSIGENAFAYCKALSTVFYRGTEAQKSDIDISWYENVWLKDASWHYQVEGAVFAEQNCYYCAKCDNYYLPDGSQVLATITFLNWDGTAISTQKLPYKASVVEPTTPIREVDDTYSYTFAGWDNEVMNCSGNATYTATYNISCTHTYQYGICSQCGYNCGHNVENEICTLCRSYGTCGDNLTWILDEEGSLTISGTGAMTTWGSAYSVPWRFSIPSIKSVVIGDHVTSIGNYAFVDCSKLTSITIPNSVLRIGVAAFDDCTGLTDVYITDIDAWCEISFYGNSSNPMCYGANLNLNNELVTDLIIPAGISQISQYAFCGCNSITNVVIPDGVISIADGAFAGCRGLTSVTIPDSVANIGYCAFDSCNGLIHVFYSGTEEQWETIHIDTEQSIINNNNYYLNSAFRHYEAANGKITTKELCTVTAYHCNLCDNYFHFTSNGREHLFVDDVCTTCGVSENLNYTIDSTGIVTITGYTGEETELTIPRTIESLPVISIGNSAFRNYTGLTSITIPDSVTSIGDSAFYGCTGLTGITIPDRVISIGGYAFHGCTGLANITIPDSVTSIGDSAFWGCTGLTSVTIGNGVTSIGEYAFARCTGLMSVTIGNGVTNIGRVAFDACTALLHVFFAGTETQWDAIDIGELNGSLTNSFRHYETTGGIITTTELCTVTEYYCNVCDDYFHYASNGRAHPFVDGICSTCGVSESLNYTIDSTGIVTITGYTGEESELTIPHTIESLPVINIGRSAFNGCSGLTSITIPDTVTSIGNSAFWYCERLTSVTIGNGVTSIGDSAFEGCDSLTSVTIGNGVTSIGDSAFRSCNRLTSIIIPEGVTSIGNSAFEHCMGLTHITIPNSVTSIGDNAFSWCYYFSSVFYRGTQAQKDAIDISSTGNKDLTDAEWHYQITDAVFAEQDCYYCPECNNYYLPSGGYAWATITFQNWDGTPISTQEKYYNAEVYTPGIPTRPHEQPNVFQYVFIGWDKEVVKCTGNATYTAVYEERYVDYEVVFKNWNGSVISTKTYHWGDTVTTPADPTRTADNTYTYDFAGWDNEVVNCAGNTTYTATYTPTYREYTVVFKDDLTNTVYSSKTYHWGDTVTAPTNPTRAADNIYTYTFTGWHREVTNCEGATTYYANFASTYIDYTVVFKNWNGEVLSSQTCHWGDLVIAPDATREEDNIYTYRFCKWDKDVSMICAGNATYTAMYEASYIDYIVKFEDWDGDTLSYNTYHWGDAVTTPADPTRTADSTYTYAFKGWDTAVVNCAGDTTYTATYTPSYINYTVVFKNWDGSVLSSKTYHYGDTVSAPAAPTRPNDNQNAYIFTGWDKTVVNCAGNAIYTAVYSTKSLVPSTITSSQHTVSGGTISKIGVGTTAGTLLGNLSEGSYAKVYQGDKEVAKDALIGTGMIVKIMDGNTETASATVIVTGDINGDGKVTVTDMLAAKAHLLKKSTLQGTSAQAADTNGDGGISITDFIQMKAHVLGKSQVEPKSTVTVVQTSAVSEAPENAQAVVVTTALPYVQTEALVPEKKLLALV